jgi:hemerythrin-like metal-binding protein
MTRDDGFFVWKQGFALGLPVVDEEHRHFFEILNRCARAAAEGAAPRDLDTVLSELDTYARFHFSSEEAELERVGYPELELQRAEHRRFEAQLERLRESERTTILSTLAFMRDWMLQHVLGTDRRFVPWITKERIVPWSA